MTSPYDECPSLFPRAKNSANSPWHLRPRPGCHFATATKFCTVAITECRSTARNLLHVTRPVPRILSWLLDFWTLSAPLLTTTELNIIDILGLNTYSKRGKNNDKRHCVKHAKNVKWCKKRPCYWSRLYRFDGKQKKYEQGALLEW